MSAAVDLRRREEAHERIHLARIAMGDAVGHVFGEQPPEFVAAHHWRSAKGLRVLAELMRTDPVLWDFDGFAGRMSHAFGEELAIVTGLEMHRWPPVVRQVYVRVQAEHNTAEAKLNLLAARRDPGLRARRR